MYGDTSDSVNSEPRSPSPVLREGPCQPQLPWVRAKIACAAEINGALSG
jgi:hypothetical protein